MEVNSAFSNAISGIQRGMGGLTRNAEEIVKATTGEGEDIIKPLVESKLNQVQVEASAKVVKAVDDTMGSLLDEMA